jgi:hypothetical protein
VIELQLRLALWCNEWQAVSGREEAVGEWKRLKFQPAIGITSASPLWWPSLALLQRLPLVVRVIPSSSQLPLPSSSFKAPFFTSITRSILAAPLPRYNGRRSAVYVAITLKD